MAIVENPQAFLTSAATPLPVCLWVNPLKGDAIALTEHLTHRGVVLEPITWMPGAFRAGNWRSPGHTLPFTAGWYYVQEEIAMVAVWALDPQPGERILDLCAAPGGKTAQIAVRLQGSGMVLANELHAARLPSLSATVARLGLTNVLTTQADGRSVAFPPHSFDRVLVDAPCSGEGNLRRRQRSRPWHPTHGLRIAAAQKKLLSRALDWVKPGGTVVYSTCTFAPEENEAVLDAVLGDRAEVEPFDVPGLCGQSGLTHWQGQAYRQDVARARRYWPHLNNTGGFFVAKLRRSNAGLSAADPLPLPEIPPVPIEPEPVFQTLSRHFAIAPPGLQPYQCWSTGKRRLWLAHPDCAPLPGAMPQTIGIAIASQTNLGLKPSTAFLQRFGDAVQQNIVELPTLEAAYQFLIGASQPCKAALPSGYVQVRLGRFHLGCGQYARGQLHSQLPKTLRWSAALTDC